MKMQNNYNPDVLSCLANLSSDEVFTPPKLANEILDLLPKEIWKDKNATFLDPVCKSGVFLREIAKRLLEGLKGEIPNVQKRIDHIYKNQLFGIGITELTSFLSRRSLYCSKKANGKYSVSKAFKNEQGNIFFDRTEHNWKNGRCSFCGASQSEYQREEGLETHAYQFIHNKKPNIINNMKFDVIIGNPPYQLNDGGFGTSATPIYQKFVQQAKKLNPRHLTMIIPARWYAGGKGLDDFRDSMLKDKHIRRIVDFHDAADCFPGVELKGGVCYFLWDRDNPGLCRFDSKLTGFQLKSAVRHLDQHDIFVRFNEMVSVLEKVLSFKEDNMASIISSRKPFGFATNFTDFSKKYTNGMVKIYGQKKEGWIQRDKVPDQNSWVNAEKVYISKAYNGGYSYPHQVINKPFIPDAPSCCTETYLVCGPFKNKKQAKNCVSYLETKFLRSLVLLRKITQDNTKDRFIFAPTQNFDEEWTDEKLYKKYKLTKEEISFIESIIRPMGTQNEE